MSTQDSLSSLCTVCYTEQPKYKCPRCKTQTCSLACYKKHQQRASCNGQRDPAAFVKKSQWATPAGLDHDYNYLKSVERHIDVASDDIKSRTVPETNKKHNERQWHGDSNLQKYLLQHNITVIRAPMGMSRSRANKTRVTARGNVFWTVDWVDDTGRTETEHDIAATSTLTEIFTALYSKRAKPGRHRELAGDAEEPPSKKRLVEELETGSSTVSRQVLSRDQENEDVTTVKQDTGTVEDAQHYYLFKPGTTSAAKVLIPLSPEATLTQALSGQTVQEFPTLLTLPHKHDELPQSYHSIATWTEGIEQRRDDKQETVNAATSAYKPPSAAQVIEMLRKDRHTT